MNAVLDEVLRLDKYFVACLQQPVPHIYVLAHAELRAIASNSQHRALAHQRRAGVEPDQLIRLIELLHGLMRDQGRFSLADNSSLTIDVHTPAARNRSEERRVGKECRSRWSP